ncbi:MAG: hypothetical protein HYT93_01755 [Parcubacteria group bacterium]|nr:hypothetical protein [Parcubacteria group bacterium]
MTEKQHVYIAFLVLILASFVGYIIYTDVAVKNNIAKSPTLNEVEGSNMDEVQEKNIPEGVLVEVPQNTTATEDGKMALTTPVPDLDRQIVIPDSTHPSQKDEIISKISALVVLLKQDASLFNEWIDLGLRRKSIEDYEGARQAWEYASVIRPNNSISFGNLGALYGYYLGNPILAEKNYLKAIENDSKLPYLYVQTADFYLEVLKDVEKAKEILKKGLIAVPGDEALKLALDAIE